MDQDRWIFCLGVWRWQQTNTIGMRGAWAKNLLRFFVWQLTWSGISLFDWPTSLKKIGENDLKVESCCTMTMIRRIPWTKQFLTSENIKLETDQSRLSCIRFLYFVKNQTLNKKFNIYSPRRGSHRFQPARKEHTHRPKVFVFSKIVCMNKKV